MAWNRGAATAMSEAGDDFLTKPVPARHIAAEELVKHEAAETAANLGEEPVTA